MERDHALLANAKTRQYSTSICRSNGSLDLSRDGGWLGDQGEHPLASAMAFHRRIAPACTHRIRI
jgi:hypothetical protein